MDSISKRCAEIYPLIYSWKTDDLPYWVEVAKKYASRELPILELGFGTGRIGIHLARLGYGIVGIDSSKEMLSVALEKISKEPIDVQRRIKLVEGDMRNFKLDNMYQLIFFGFNSFLCLLTSEDQIAALKTVKVHLADNGILALDVIYPDFNLLYDLPQWIKERDIELPENDYRLIRDMTRHVDPIQQIITVTFRIQEQKKGKTETWYYDEKITYIFPRE